MSALSEKKTPADAAPTFELKLHRFWRKNRRDVLAACAIVLIAIAGRGAWEYFASQREKNIQAEYTAANTPEKLRAFALNHTGNPLAGVADLRLADDEYLAGKYNEALPDYISAADRLGGTLFSGRAQLGQAICKIQTGRVADGEAQLKQLAYDLSQLHSLRAEAVYHLASEAADQGRVDDAKKFADEAQQIAPGSVWAERANALAANLTPQAQPNEAPEQPPLFRPKK
ncbi:MAG: tetratricopeptide repeat protein [Verrucomicrobiota bacterium]|nr:tetratricopeptide repeat protein [Verrucomicrobiota bacterium]